MPLTGIALFAARRADVHVLLPADLQGQTRERWANQVDLWLTDLPGDTQLSDLRAAPLPAAALDLDQCRLSLCTSGSSGEPKLIENACGNWPTKSAGWNSCGARSSARHA